MRSYKIPFRVITLTAVFALIPLLLPALLAAEEQKNYVDLPAPRLDGGRPLMAVLSERRSNRSFDQASLNDLQMAEILWAALGVNRQDGSNRRTSPTGMDRQDVELYVLTAKGAFLYDALAHRLETVAEGDQTAQLKAPLGLAYVTPANNQFSGTNAAFCAQNVYLYAASEGLNTVIKATFDRAALNRLLKLPDDKTVILVQPVGLPPKK